MAFDFSLATSLAREESALLQAPLISSRKRAEKFLEANESESQGTNLVWTSRLELEDGSTHPQDRKWEMAGKRAERVIGRAGNVGNSPGKCHWNLLESAHYQDTPGGA